MPKSYDLGITRHSMVEMRWLLFWHACLSASLRVYTYCWPRSWDLADTQDHTSAHKSFRQFHPLVVQLTTSLWPYFTSCLFPYTKTRSFTTLFYKKFNYWHQESTVKGCKKINQAKRETGMVTSISNKFSPRRTKVIGNQEGPQNEKRTHSLRGHKHKDINL